MAKKKKNYYAVARGYQPGIYKQWFGERGAQAQIKGFSGPVYKGFVTLNEAEEWLRAKQGNKATDGMSNAPDVKSTKKKKYYAVIKGRQPGIYEEWFGEDGAEAQIKHFSGAVFQSFATKELANKWFAEVQAEDNEETVDFSEETVPHQKALDEGLVVIYSDGGSLGNPGPGGYGVVLLYQNQRKELSQGYMLTTNNRMELLGSIRGLEALKNPSRVALYTDSQYVVNGMTKGWAKKWQANNWMRSVTQEAKNADLWKQLLKLCTLHEVKFYWVRGHVGVEENERCDELATQSAAQRNLLIDEGYQGP